jgi:hypothetical protein
LNYAIVGERLGLAEGSVRNAFTEIKKKFAEFDDEYHQGRCRRRSAPDDEDEEQVAVSPRAVKRPRLRLCAPGDDEEQYKVGDKGEEWGEESNHDQDQEKDGEVVKEDGKRPGPPIKIVLRRRR